METDICTRLTTLGHPQRLAVFRLLMRRYPDQVPAGEIAAALAIKPSTLSAYLAALTQAGLVAQHRIATSLRYSIAMDAVNATFADLLLDCCRGRPDLCATVPLRSDAVTTFNVLFVCTGNSARSIMAEAILHRLAGERFTAFSAGTLPRSDLNPFALEILRRKGHDISRLVAKNVTTLTGPDAPVFDFVFTVCDQAANEDCPLWTGQPISAHWGLPDPVRTTGTDSQKNTAFLNTYGALYNRINAFTALPFASLDRLSLQKAVDDIGRNKQDIMQ